MGKLLWLAVPLALYAAACLYLYLSHPPARLPEAGTDGPLPRFPAGFLFGTATSAHE
jgi:hypothetical protein